MSDQGEVEAVRKMLIMDFAGFPGEHYIGSAERIVAALDACRAEPSPAGDEVTDEMVTAFEEVFYGEHPQDAVRPLRRALQAALEARRASDELQRGTGSQQVLRGSAPGGGMATTLGGSP